MEPKNILLEMKDYIVEMGAETINWCMQCGLCTNLCPWRLVPGQTSEEFNIRYMQRLGQMGIEGFEDETMLFACSTLRTGRSRLGKMHHRFHQARCEVVLGETIGRNSCCR